MGCCKGKARDAANRVKSFVSAITGGRVTDEMHSARLAVCLVCEHCEHIGKGLYCRRCGCPKWWLADLRHKAKMSRARCPMHKWQEPGENADDE